MLCVESVTTKPTPGYSAGSIDASPPTRLAGFPTTLWDIIAFAPFWRDTAERASNLVEEHGLRKAVKDEAAFNLQTEQIEFGIN